LTRGNPWRIVEENAQMAREWWGNGGTIEASRGAQSLYHNARTTKTTKIFNIIACNMYHPTLV
jgi:hypothetical protein